MTSCVLDEPTSHLDIEGLDALMEALNKWNGGVIVVSHDVSKLTLIPSPFNRLRAPAQSRFINTVCKELWVVGDQKAEKLQVASALSSEDATAHTLLMQLRRCVGIQVPDRGERQGQALSHLNCKMMSSAGRTSIVCVPGRSPATTLKSPS